MHNVAMRRRIYDQELFAHFVTFSVERRRRLLDYDQPKRIILGCLYEELETFGSTCVGYVIMPNHVHAVIWLPKPGQLSEFMHAWKRKSSFHVKEWYRDAAPDYPDEYRDGKFWQPKYYSFEIYQRAKLEEKLQYMHENPVRAGLVMRATDWRWSSARWYAWQQTVGVPIRWIE
jgi:putative transposase